MVQINIDTDKDSPETIAKIIEMLHLAIGSRLSGNVSNSLQGSSISSSEQYSVSSSSLPSSAPIQTSSNPFDMFGSNSESIHNSLSSLSSPVRSSESSGIFDVFGSEDRPNQQSSNKNISSSSSVVSSSPFSMFDEPSSSTTEKNSSAGFADDNFFNSFSNDLPSTNYRSQNASSHIAGLEASFESAQTLLDDDFNPIQPEVEESEVESTKKSSNFFSFEQY